MPRIAKADFFVFGTRISYQHVRALEIDWFVVVENCPNSFAAENLIAFVVRFIYMF
jgi:hypothetical protein